MKKEHASLYRGAIDVMVANELNCGCCQSAVSWTAASYSRQASRLEPRKVSETIHFLQRIC
jgi:hypothetical protein